MISTRPIPFSIDHLLLAGLIIDRGQLSLARKAELDRRAALGELVKALYRDKDGVARTWCWKVREG